MDNAARITFEEAGPFYAEVKRLAALPKDERHATLRAP